MGITPLVSGAKFVLNILKEGRAIRRHFSTQRGTTEAFEHLSIQVSDSGCAILLEALAYLDCTVMSRLSVGDHDLLFATVQQAGCWPLAACQRWGIASCDTSAEADFCIQADNVIASRA
ncbi:MAG: hypothetical protein HC929_15885 [Leptolyngbyaceae cyanobacterium SM2_5_2]|nr:hypothetical protein [Leptolyngbyaceae cyanobacterium SM2_5_2]